MKTPPLSDGKIQYRLLSKAPGDRRYKYRPFTGSRSDDKQRVVKAMERFTVESPGWQFKLQSRTVIITATPWKETKP